MSVARAKYLLMTLLLLGATSPAFGQFFDCSSGLLQCPSAEMNPSGTFMITNNFLNKHTLSTRWGYHTFGYGFNITIFSRIEVTYAMAIFDGKRHPNPSERDLIMFNQDRHFSTKLLVLREGEFQRDWVPSLAVGVCDPVSGYKGGGSYIEGDVTTNTNGFFNRMYIVATKHFNTPYGVLAGHLGYQWNLREDPRYNAPCAAVSWDPVWLDREFVSVKLIAEYDARTFNVGLIASLYHDHFDLMFDLQAMKWVTAGIRYKLILK